MINENDIVDVYYNDRSELKGVKVLHRPSDVGDLWCFECEDGTEYAQNPISTNLDVIVKASPTKQRRG